MAFFYKIEEAVDRHHYIVLDGIYETPAAAQAAINRLPHNEYMRVQLYQTGGAHGPERVTDRYFRREADQ